MSQKELQDRLNYLYSLLNIDHRNTSSFLRTKTSATDNGPSSVSIGITGVILLVFVMLFIILLDILPRN
jgi:ABC-type multidrug transport system permease subunit